MKHTKKALLTSAVSLVLCFVMLIGTTFAWFTDKVEVTGNRIVAGNLDVELYHTNTAVTDEKVTGTTPLFTDKLGKEFLWEPGAVIWENFTVKNVGDLALKYRLDLIFTDDNYVVRDGVNYYLSDVLKMGIVTGGVTTGDRAAVLAQVESFAGLASWVENNKTLSKDGTSTVGIVIYWEPSANDNLYNVNNGAVTSNNGSLAINFDILLQATQQTEESDSIDSTYDSGAYLVDLPEAGVEVKQNVAWEASGYESLIINTDYALKFTVPEDEEDAYYEKWNADFVLTFDKDIKANQVVLIGKHIVGTEALPIMEDVPAGTPIRVMLDVFVPILGPSINIDPENVPENEGLSYDMVKLFCGDTGFECGLTTIASVLNDNPGLTLEAASEMTGLELCGEELTDTNVTIELRMYETTDEVGEFSNKETGVSYIISSYSYTMN